MTEEKPRLEPASDGYQVFYRNRRLYTPHGPRAGAVRRATAARPDPGTLILAASPLLGYGIAELLDAAPADTVVLAVEFDSSLAELTRRAAEEEFGHLAEQDPRLVLLLAPSAEELEQTVQSLLRRRPRRTRLVTLSGGFGLQAERYRALQSHIDREIRIYWQNTMTRVQMGRLWIRNVLRNLPLVPTATPTETLYRRVPTVVVGAGPSLDEKVALLPPDGHPRRRHLRILAVDTAAAPLAARGVTPDLVLAVESQQANAADFLGTPLSRPDCPTQLICDLSAYPGSTHAVAPERLSFVSSRFASTILLDRLDESRVRPMSVPPLGSVGVLAVHLARRLGGEPVYLMGLDFAYDLERTHARGAPMHTLNLLRRTRTDPSPFFDLALSRPLIRQEDKRGRSVRTDTVLFSYAEQLQSVVREAGAVYDLSPDHGLPTGAPGAGAPEAGAIGATPQDTPHTIRATEAVEAVFESEGERIDELCAELRPALETAGTAERVAEGHYERLMPLLDRCDYVYLDFPDAPAPTRAFLGRVLLSALSYRDRLRRALLLLHRVRG